MTHPVIRPLDVLTASDVSKHLPMRRAIDALAGALRDGLEPGDSPPRIATPLRNGGFLLMPGEFGAYAGVKVLTVGTGAASASYPRIQGNYLLFDAHTMQPIAALDGIALTSIRTPAMSAVAVDRLAPTGPCTLVVFGTGPQALAHVHAIGTVRELEDVAIVGRSAAGTERILEELTAAGFSARAADTGVVGDADIIACCTTSREPLFDGASVRDEAVVVAMGSHEPDARETDDVLAKRSVVYVEDVENALREAGDVVIALENDCLDLSEVRTITELVRQEQPPHRSGPAFVKTVGMGWQDLIVASATWEHFDEERGAR